MQFGPVDSPDSSFQLADTLPQDTTGMGHIGGELHTGSNSINLLSFFSNTINGYANMPAGYDDDDA